MSQAGTGEAVRRTRAEEWEGGTTDPEAAVAGRSTPDKRDV